MRLRRMNVRSRELATDGVRALFGKALYNIDKAERELAVSVERLNQLRHDDVRGLATLYVELKSSEARIGAVDHIIVPVLSNRTKSDPKYDEFLARFISELKLGPQRPATSHKQWAVDTVHVDLWFGDPIFLFSPSIRSFAVISLLYHEIGHFVWWKVFTLSERLELVQRMVSLFRLTHPQMPRRADGETPDELQQRLVYFLRETFASEIAADAFAGLVGGHAFVSNLCAFALLRENITLPPSRKHPPAVWRVWFARLANRASGCPSEDLEDPLLDAWGAIVGLNEPVPEDTCPLLWNEKDAMSWLDAFKEVLNAHQIPLAGTVKRPHFEDAIPRMRWRSVPVPTLLLAASKYKGNCESQSEYVRWERKVFSELGLTPKGLLQRLIQRFWREE